jgi:hypothetical protein
LISKTVPHFTILGSTHSQFVGFWHRVRVHEVNAETAITAPASGPERCPGITPGYSVTGAGLERYHLQGSLRALARASSTSSMPKGFDRRG